MSKKVRKRGPQRIFESGNYFPDLALGLEKNYVYYNSLLTGDDEKFEGNRRIGKEVQDELINNIGNKYLKPDIDNSENVILPALQLILQAADNERKKEMAWISQICEILGIGENINLNTDNFNYIEFIKIVNEAQSGYKSSLAAIAFEKERWGNIDIKAILEAKKQQRHYEAKARNLERKKNKDNNSNITNEEIDDIREQGARQYYDTLRTMSGQDIKKNILTPLNSQLETIRSNCHKFFTSPRSNFVTQVIQKILPIALKSMNLKQNEIHFNVALLDQVLQSLIMTIVEDIVTNEIIADLDAEKGGKSTFLSKSAKDKGRQLSDTIDKLLSSKSETDKLERLAQSIYRENANTQQLEQKYQSNQYSDFLSDYKQNDKQTQKIISQLLKNLRQQKSIQDEYYKETGNQWKSGYKKSTNQFNEWLVNKYQLKSDFSIASILETVRNSVSGNWYYSEMKPLQHSIMQGFNLDDSMLKGDSFRPVGFPKTDVLAGYLTCDITYNDAPLKQKQLYLQKYIKNFEKEQNQLNKSLQDLFNGTNNSGLQFEHRIGDATDYAQNAEAFKELRAKQLAILDNLTNELLKQQKNLDIALTRFNVLTTVKDQEGILSPRRGQAIGAKGKNFIEAGVGFSGGAMGQNDAGLNVIDNLVALGKEGKILNDEDTIWLKFALLNSGLGLLGFKNRASLENYFSLFASFLMFDDAQNIVADAIYSKADEIGKQNTVQEIHLYYINGIYFPQSYILKELYNYLSEAIINNTFNQRNLSKSTVRTQIYGYNVGSKYPGNTKEDWERESSEAKSKTKIKMYFLMNMADVVNQLYEKMNKSF